MHEFDQANERLLKMLPSKQMDEVFGQDMVDIDASFLGFVHIYESLARIIPRHWTVVDLGCAYAPQAFFFTDHKSYIGVDFGNHLRFRAPNTIHFDAKIESFIKDHVLDFDLSTTFAICSYVPPWFADNAALVRGNFKNCFVFYPAGGPCVPTIRCCPERVVAA